MLQREFEELMGEKFSNEEFEKYNAMYMDTDLDKIDFCELIKNGQMKVLRELIKQTQRAKELGEKGNKMVDFLIEQGEKWSASDLREKAIKMIGEKEYLRRKIEKGFNLWEADKKILLEVLKN